MWVGGWVGASWRGCGAGVAVRGSVGLYPTSPVPSPYNRTPHRPRAVVVVLGVVVVGGGVGR